MVKEFILKPSQRFTVHCPFSGKKLKYGSKGRPLKNYAHPWIGIMVHDRRYCPDCNTSFYVRKDPMLRGFVFYCLVKRSHISLPRWHAIEWSDRISRTLRTKTEVPVEIWSYHCDRKGKNRILIMDMRKPDRLWKARAGIVLALRMSGWSAKKIEEKAGIPRRTQSRDLRKWREPEKRKPPWQDPDLLFSYRNGTIWRKNGN